MEARRTKSSSRNIWLLFFSIGVISIIPGNSVVAFFRAPKVLLDINSKFFGKLYVFLLQPFAHGIIREVMAAGKLSQPIEHAVGGDALSG
jgi:hypothetical protein